MISPRCLLHNMPMFLSADNHLKPCCFLNTTTEWDEFKKWAEGHNLNIEDDLNVNNHTMAEIINSPTWIKLLDGFKTGDVPRVCNAECGPGSYSSTNQSSKHSDYISGN